MNSTKNKQNRVWILEDDPGVRFVYEELLGLRYDLKQFTNCGDLVRAVASDALPEVLIADVRLPDQSFLSLMAEKNGEFKGLRIPFIVVSSVDDVDALRFFFEHGAVDYVTKPFGRSELIVKLERFFTGGLGGANRVGKNCQDFDLARFSFDPVHFTVSNSKGTSHPLTSKEYQICSLLFADGFKTVSRDHLIHSLWPQVTVSAKTLDVHLYNLRRKLFPLGIDIRFTPKKGFQPVSFAHANG